MEIDPELKERLYAKLHEEGLTCKDWFVRQALLFLEGRAEQLTLPGVTTQGPQDVGAKKKRQ